MMWLAVLLAAGICAVSLTPRAAWAISLEQDIVRDLTTVFKPPASFPPNNALRPNEVLDLEVSRRARLPTGIDAGPPAVRLDHVPARAYPFVVAIVENERPAIEGYFCAGALIAPEWVVTAAHCTFAWFRRWPIDAEVFVVTDTVALAKPGPKFTATAVIPHPNFNPRTLENDIALVKIDSKGAKHIGPPIRLEGPPIDEQAGQIAQVLGWGVTNLTIPERQMFESLQLVQMIVRTQICFESPNFPRLKGTGVFCASPLHQYHDICYSFGGSPIVLRDTNKVRYLAGLVSWPANCPPEIDRLHPYLDVQHYVPWIRATIAATGGRPEAKSGAAR